MKLHCGRARQSTDPNSDAVPGGSTQEDLFDNIGPMTLRPTISSSNRGSFSFYFYFCFFQLISNVVGQQKETMHIHLCFLNWRHSVPQLAYHRQVHSL